MPSTLYSPSDRTRHYRLPRSLSALLYLVDLQLQGVPATVALRLHSKVVRCFHGVDPQLSTLASARALCWHPVPGNT